MSAEMSMSTFQCLYWESSYSLTLSLESEEHHDNLLKPAYKDRTIAAEMVGLHFPICQWFT